MNSTNKIRATREQSDLLSGFLRSVSTFPTRPALEVGGQAQTYAQLYESAIVLAATLLRRCEVTTGLTAILAYRSEIAYTGILAALLRGHGYVPLNRTFPVERTRSMLQRADCRELIVDEGSESHLCEMLPGIKTPLLIVLPHRETVSDLSTTWHKHQFLGARDLSPAEGFQAPPVDESALAYVLFTSGSTGEPKGVMVTRHNVRAFIDAAGQRYDFNEKDRFSQYFDLTFDLASFDIFMAWEYGACVCCLAPSELIAPGRFINSARLTVWFSVPSTIGFMASLGLLKPGSYPNLRWSLFCGEALPIDAVEQWCAAAPHARVENLYGPTELTIACTAYRCDLGLVRAESEQGIVPIGEALPGTEVLVVNEDLHEVAPGKSGELLGTGGQLARGYLHDLEKTAAAFVKPAGRNEDFYRTGDLVRRPALGKPMTFLGRIDNQIKVRGFRVELQEIEAVLREVEEVLAAVAVGWPRITTGAGGIVAFLEGSAIDVSRVEEHTRRRLPAYMVPREYHILPTLPRNPNGKLDRKVLLKRLEDTQ